MIRAACQQDLSEIMEIENQNEFFPRSEKQFDCFLKKPYQTYILSSLTKKPLDEKNLRNNKKSLNNSVTGFAIIMDIFPEAELIQISIKKEYQHQGQGYFFLNAIIEQLKAMKYQKIFLEVRTSNSAAKSLYRKLGFSFYHQRKNYYPALLGKEDAELYALELKASF